MSEAETQITNEPLRAVPKTSPVLEALRAKREQLSRERYFDVELPGYGGLWVLRCGPVATETMTVLRERMQRSKSPARDFNLNADWLFHATREVMVRTTTEEELEPLRDAEGEPVGIDVRLVDLLGEAVPELQGCEKARELVRALFAGANSPDLAVSIAAGEYLEWASRAGNEIDEELLGESPAARESSPGR